MSNNAIPQTAKQREHNENKAEETKEPRGPPDRARCYHH